MFRSIRAIRLIRIIKLIVLFTVISSFTILPLFPIVPRASAAFSLNLTRPGNYLGLVGYWTFDGKDIGSSGIVAKDSSGNNNHGTLTNGPLQVAGKVGQALNFDGVNDLVNTGSEFIGTSALTISVWVYRENAGGTQRIVSNNKTILSTNTVGRMLFTSSGATAATSGNNCANVGKWTHVAVTRDASGDATFYCDGAQYGTPNQTSGTPAAGTENVYIGNRGSGTEPWDGPLDEVRIYNRILSAAEITKLYQSAQSKFNSSQTKQLTNGLVGYWTFDGKDTSWTSATAGTTRDLSGNNNTGTLTNMSQSTTPAAGKVGQALNFDGVNDYVDRGTGPTVVNSVSFWVYPETTTEYFVNLTGTTDFIWVNAGTVTATGLTSPTIYVDGSVSSTLVTNKWQHVVVTTATSENASNLDLGRTEDANYLQGKLDEVRIYNRALSAAEITQLYQSAQSKFNSSQTNQLTNGLVGYWTLDGPNMASTSGVVARDSSGNNNNGTLTNGPTKAIGKVGQALNFDGVDDYVNAGSASILDNLENQGGGGMTVSVWVNADTINSGTKRLVAKGVGSAGSGYWAFIASNSTSPARIGFAKEGSTDMSVSWNSVLSLQTWTHLLLTWDGTMASSGVNLYKNGVLETRDITTEGATANSDASNNLTIGSDASAGNYFDGTIDEVRVYNRALSAAEITQLYLMGK